MQIISRSLGQPAFHLLVFVSAVVVDDQMHIEIRCYTLVNVVEETKKLLVSMPTAALRDHVASCHIQCSKNRHRAVPYVVVRHAFDIPKTHREQGLGPL